jgi:photosystem II PsbH protein
METNQYPPKKIAPLQYLFRKLNSNSGMVVRGWGTAPLMVGLTVLFFLFLLIILQIANASILLEGIDVDWSILHNYAAEVSPSGTASFGSTGFKIFFGLLALGLSCVALIVYGSLTYPSNQK